MYIYQVLRITVKHRGNGKSNVSNSMAFGLYENNSYERVDRKVCSLDCGLVEGNAAGVISSSIAFKQDNSDQKCYWQDTGQQSVLRVQVDDKGDRVGDVSSSEGFG